MNNFNTNIMGDYATDFFYSLPDYSTFFANNIYTALMRYLALKDANGDLASANPVVQGIDYIENENHLQRAFEKGSEFELIVSSKTDKFKKPNDNWEQLDSRPFPVALFLSKYRPTKVFINKFDKRAVVTVDKVEANWILALCSTIFRILPWRFGDSLTNDEVAIFTAINKEDYNALGELIDKFIEPYDFRAEVFAKKLIGWNDHYRKAKMETLKREIDVLYSDIISLQAQLSRCYNDIAENNTAYSALSLIEDDDPSGLFEFFNMRRQLDFIEVRSENDGKSLIYSVTECLEDYDKDEVKKLLENRRSFMYTTTKQIRDVIKAIFIEEKATIRTNCAFKLKNLSSLEPQKNIRYSNASTAMNHPHIYHYGCLGGNLSYVNKFMDRGDWELAIEQTISAARNINWGDNVVMPTFLRDIERIWSSSKCVITKDGEEMTFKEFYDKIKEENNPEVNNG